MMKSRFLIRILTKLDVRELSKMVDRKLLINHPIYIDSATIAPLLSIAPDQIFFYSVEPEKPIIRTISNIFEERLIIKKPMFLKSYD